MKRAIVAVLGCVALGIGGGIDARHDGELEESGQWSAPVNLGPIVNSSVRDAGAAVSRDGLSLYLSSSRAGTTAADLYVSRRLGIDLPWETPMPLEMLNSAVGDGSPSLSRDDRFLFFNSGRSGGPPDLWVSERRHTQDDFGWEPPVRLPSPPNGPGQEVAPAYVEVPGGTPQLYFSSSPGNPAGLDIYVTELREDGTWSDPENLAVLNSPFEDAGSAIRFDGKEMIFASRRGGNLDLYVTRRTHRWEPWSAPENLGPDVNTASQEFAPSLSHNGRTLYFASDRPGGFGNFDLYASTRSRLRR